MKISYPKMSAMLLVIAAIPTLYLPTLGEAATITVSRSVPIPLGVTTKTVYGTTEVMPPALRPVFYRSLAEDAGAAYNVNTNGCATLPKEKLTACFDSTGVHFNGNSSFLALHLVAYGRSDRLKPARRVRPAIEGNRVSYARDNMTEWWRALPVGFEQGFTVAKRPGGSGMLTLALGVNHDPDRHDGTLGWDKLRYGNLVVTDANGKVVPATLKSRGDRILIAVNDVRATYPITVDPLVWLEQEVTASDGAAGDLFGTSLVVSGSTALVGAPYAAVNGDPYQGAVYVFTQSDGVWNQTQKLTASDGAELDEFGYSVALNNNVVIIGAPNKNATQGVAYVFAESDGIWTQAQELTAGDGQSGDFFGGRAILAGSTALIGAGYATVDGNAAQGSAYVFTESGDAWAQAQELTASDGAANDQFGNSIAFDGTVILIGAPYHAVNDNIKQGAAYIFAKSGGIWNQTQELVANDGAAANFFGWSVAVAGTTALVGADHATVNGNFNQGAVYVFGNTGGNWEQMQKLVASDGASSDNFGWSVALVNAIALIGANFAAVNGQSQQGAAYLFDNSGGTWSQTYKLSASNGAAGAKFGQAVAISGANVLVSANWTSVNGNNSQGAAYFYGGSDLGLALSAPATVGQGQQYVSQTIATNNASAASPAVTATVTVPAAASFVSATASQGSCNEDSGVVTCDFGAINGNAGTATANVMLKATGNVGDTIENTASVAHATPPLSASAPTTITAGGACPAGYTEYDGTLAPGERAGSPGYAAPAGEENGILTSPPGFRLFALVKLPGQEPQLIGADSRNEMHHWAPKGFFKWIVQAWAGSPGGAYTLCVLHP